ncbi:hypothetical protein VTK73DRAFT_3634 [Phialemonium thermophilum]|uniref:Secreted protein n=1 Tax=Phialemonium thermophilum TaxID=223376 RepID=A0ABR3WYL6_9PEZI
MTVDPPVGEPVCLCVPKMIPRALYAVAACASVVSSLSEGVLDGDPSPNLLDYASNVATAGGTSSDSLCEATVSDGRLVYPEARIDHQTSGHVDCVSRLQLSGWPSGYRFSVSGVSVSGFLQLDPGSYVEKIEVDFSYTGGVGSPPSFLFAFFFFFFFFIILQG